MKARALLLFVALGAVQVAAEDATEARIRGERNDTVFAQGKERSVWRGNAVLESEGTTIYADTIELFGKDFVFAECHGNLRVENLEDDIYLTCEKLTYDRKDKYITAVGNVYMEDRRNGIVVKGDFLQQDEDTEETTVQVRVRIFRVEDDLQCKAEFARYFRKEEQLVLTGLPYALWKGDEYRAAKIFIDLDKDTVRMQGAEGRITEKDEEEGGESE
jgi:lipopolysaccharide export system protein LptA